MTLWFDIEIDIGGSRNGAYPSQDLGIFWYLPEYEERNENPLPGATVYIDDGFFSVTLGKDTK